MQFRFTCAVEGFVIADPLLNFSTGDAGRTDVSLRRPTSEEIGAGEDREDVVCVATVEHRLPAPSRKELGALPEVGSVAFESFTIETQRELSKLQRDLTATMADVVDVLRWRSAAPGPHNPLVFRAFEFRDAHGKWRSIARPVMFRRRWRFPVSFGTAATTEIQQLLDRGIRQPIGFSLLSEAREQWLDNPRSALVLAYAAIEVGIKQCLVRLAPDTAWILEKFQSPPVSDLLQHMVTPLVQRDPALACYAPPEPFTQTIRSAAKARNDIVHRPRMFADEKSRITLEQLAPLPLENLLDTVSDLLWLFDYYLGYSWAISQVRPSTLQALIDRNGGRALPHMGPQAQAPATNGVGSFADH